MKRLFRNPRPAVYAIFAFVLVLLGLFAVKARADQTLAVEAGSAMLRGETPTLGFTIACKGCGPVETDYEYGFELIGTSSHYQDNPNVIQLHAQIVDGWKNFEMGLGFFGTNIEHEYTCRFGFHLLARLRRPSHWWGWLPDSAQYRHSSSAGSCKPNAGRDLLTLGWTFGQ